jgi:hypothetical protein
MYCSFNTEEHAALYGCSVVGREPTAPTVKKEKRSQLKFGEREMTRTQNRNQETLYRMLQDTYRRFR